MSEIKLRNSVVTSLLTDTKLMTEDCLRGGRRRAGDWPRDLGVLVDEEAVLCCCFPGEPRDAGGLKGTRGNESLLGEGRTSPYSTGMLSASFTSVIAASTNPSVSGSEASLLAANGRPTRDHALPPSPGRLQRRPLSAPHLVALTTFPTCHFPI